MSTSYKVTSLSHKFVECIPQLLEHGVLYISMEYGTVAHRCCCGCGREVVTPLTPTDWKLTFDGETISLYPSIGNWSFPCRSHYVIRNSRIEWAADWSEEDVQEAIIKDRILKDKYYSRAHQPINIGSPKKDWFWLRLWKYLVRR